MKPAPEESVLEVITDIQETQEVSPIKFVSPSKKATFLGRINPSHHDVNWKEEDELKIKVKPKYRNHRTYKFCVMTGNYPQTLRDTIRARGNWKEIGEDDAIDVAHFLFRPVNYGPSGYIKMNSRAEFMDDMLVFNHFEVLRDICTKSGLIRSLDYYYRTNKEAK